MRVSHLPLIVGALAACSNGDPQTIRVDLPITPAHRAAIVAVEDSALGELQVHAARVLEDGTITPIGLALPGDAELSLTGLLYEDTLDALGIQQGRLPPFSGEPFRSLPTAAARFSARVKGGSATGWSPLAQRPETVAAFRLEALQPCVGFTMTSSASGLNDDVDFLTAVQVPGTPNLSGRGALMGTGEQLYYFESGRFFELDRPDSRPCGGDVIPARYRGAYQAPDGSIWLTARCGEIWRATLNLEAMRIEGLPTQSASHRDSAGTIVGPIQGDAPPDELFVLGHSNGVWDRVDPSSNQLETLYQYAMASEGDYGRQAYLGPGHAVAIWEELAELVRYRDGVVSLEEPSQRGVGLSALAHHPSFGTIVGDVQGRLLVQRGQTSWEDIADPGLLTRVRNISIYGGTFVYLDARRNLRQYSTETSSFCEPVPNPLEDKANLIAVIDDQLLLIGNREDGEVRYRWLRPAP